RFAHIALQDSVTGRGRLGRRDQTVGSLHAAWRRQPGLHHPRRVGADAAQSELVLRSRKLYRTRNWTHPERHRSSAVLVLPRDSVSPYAGFVLGYHGFHFGALRHPVRLRVPFGTERRWVPAVRATRNCRFNRLHGDRESLWSEPAAPLADRRHVRPGARLRV